jgi:hypothetical protein
MNPDIFPPTKLLVNEADEKQKHLITEETKDTDCYDTGDHDLPYSEKIFDASWSMPETRRGVTCNFSGDENSGDIFIISVLKVTLLK